MTGQELKERVALAKELPGIAHLILAGPSPTCALCGGTHAPIIDGRHLGDWCNRHPVTGRPLDENR